MHKPAHSRSEAEARYSQLRAESYVIATEAFREIYPGLSVGRITPEALLEADKWERRSERRVQWSWRVEHARFARRPRRVEAAFWWDDTLLCVLCLGRVSDRRVTATIHLLEASLDRPSEIVGDVARLVRDYLRIYAAACRCRNIAISSPVAELVDLYKGLGFTQELRRGKALLQLSQPLDS